MKLSKPARAGSLESNDILIQLYPSEELVIDLESPVKQQFGEDIERVIRETLDELAAGPVKVIAQDRGALDFAIKARIRTAWERGQA